MKISNLISMKKYIVAAALVLTAWQSRAQQDAMYTQYMFNTLAINPAYAGSRNVPSLTGLYRSQWVGVEGAPETQTVSFDTALPNKRIGAGIQVFNDKLGITNTTGANLSYAYRILMEKGTLAFGLQASVTQYRADFSSVRLNSANPSDMAFYSNVNKVMPNFGAGIYYNTDKFYLGLSTPHLFNNRLVNDSVTTSNALAARQYLHFFMSSGYVFTLDRTFKLKPSVLFKGVAGAPLQLDLNCNLWIADRFAVGAQYRTGDAVAGILELQASDQIRIGYSYDRSTSKLVDYNSGSHEIMIRYEFGFRKDRIVGPRYF